MLIEALMVCVATDHHIELVLCYGETSLVLNRALDDGASFFIGVIALICALQYNLKSFKDYFSSLLLFPTFQKGMFSVIDSLLVDSISPCMGTL